MVAIIDYGAGNTQSVINLLIRIGQKYCLTDDSDIIYKADKLILPGVGHAAPAMNALREKGLVTVLKNYEKPILGICLGMQLLYEYTEEGDTVCLGILKGKVLKFKSSSEKIPHMGWNKLSEHGGKGLFDNISENEYFYFVHSYYAEITECSLALCDYILPFTAAVSRQHIFGTQFHPEKSGKVGQQLVQNFIKL